MPDPPAPPPPGRSLLRSAAVVAAAAVLPHLSTLFAELTNDDLGFITRNPGLRPPGQLLAMFGDAFPNDDPGRGLYRPLTAISYSLERAAFGTEPWVPHAGQLVLHAATCVLLLLLLRSFVRAPIALGIAVLFTLHPVHCEVVDSVSGRSELLGLLFSLLCLLTFRRGHALPAARRWPWLAASWLGFVAGTFSKESTAVLPGVLVLSALVLPQGPRRRELISTVPYFLWLPALLILRSAALHGLTPKDTVLGAPGSLRWFATVGAVAWEYARLLLWPDVLQIDRFYEFHRVRIQDALSLRGTLGWGIVLAWVGGFLISVVRALRSHPGAPVAVRALGLGWSLAAIFPVSHVVPFGALMAERFLFTPSAGLALALSTLPWPTLSSARDRALALALLTPVALALTWRSASRAAEWQDGAALWGALFPYAPGDAPVACNLAGGWHRRGDHEAERRLGELGTRLDPRNVECQLAAARGALDTGDFQAAEAGFRAAQALAPDRAGVWNGLGVVACRTGRAALCAESQREALRREPDYEAARRSLDEAEAAMERARTWLREHGPERRRDAPAATLLRFAAAHRALGEEQREAEVEGWIGAGP